jgi:hypothetical protein
MSDVSPDQSAPQDRSRLHRTFFGSLAVYLGALILLVAISEDAISEFVSLPRFWYVHRPVLIGLGILMIPVGVAVQASRTGADKRWKPAVAGRRFREVRVYSREGCHLCDEAVEVLWNSLYRPYLPVPEVIDIDEDPELRAKFDLLVPVVELDGEVRFKGRIDENLLRRLIEGTPPL